MQFFFSYLIFAKYEPPRLRKPSGKFLKMSHLKLFNFSQPNHLFEENKFSNLHWKQLSDRTGFSRSARAGDLGI